jgi:class 3 adenylate cyclase
MDDVRAVMDDVDSDGAVLWSGSEGSQVTTLFAATYPERTSGLIVLNPSTKGRPTPDYPWAPSEAEWREKLRDVHDGWGTREFFDRLLRAQVPTSLAEDAAFGDWFVTHMRRSASPGAAMVFHRMMREADVGNVLPSVRVPTLVLHSRERREPSEYFARHVPSAELHELTTMRGEFTWTDDATHEEPMAAVSAFATGLRPREETDRILTTVMFTDIVGSTEQAAELGDRAWRDLLSAHHAKARAELARYRGREVDTAGDGFLATFDGPARAVRCARAITEAVQDLGIQIQAGVHTGEVEVDGDAVRGIAVHIGARVAALAGPSEVMVSSTVKDLVAGSGLAFDDAGEHELKGVPDRWHLYRVVGS